MGLTGAEVEKASVVSPAAVDADSAADSAADSGWISYFYERAVQVAEIIGLTTAATIVEVEDSEAVAAATVTSAVASAIAEVSCR